MSTTTNTQVILKRIVTDVAIFTDKPTLAEIQHLKACGFRYDRGQWTRTETASGLHPSGVVAEYRPLTA